MNMAAQTAGDRLTDSATLAGELRKKGQYDKAIALLLAQGAEQSESPRILHELALAYRMRGGKGDYDRALRFWDRILVGQPMNLRVLRHRIDMAASFGNQSDLERFIDEACNRAPDHPSFLVRKAALLRRQGHAAQAIALLAGPAPDRPDDHAFQLELVSALHAAGRHAEAVVILDTLPGLNNVRATELRVNALAASGRPQEALAQADRFLARNPDHFGLRLRRGQMLRMVGRARESAALLTALAEEQPENLTVLSHLVSALLAVGDYPACLDVCERVLEKMPAHRGALLTRIEAMHRSENAEGLEAVLRTMARQLCEGGSAAEGPTLAECICHALNRMPDKLAHEIMQQCCGPLRANAQELPAARLWSMYRRADMLGLGSDYAAFVPLLMQHDDIRSETARDVIRLCFATGLPGWKKIAQHLLDHARAEDRSLIAGQIALLEGEPQRGLACRDRRQRPVRIERMLQIAALLRQAGRIRVAARYMDMVWRRHNDHPNLLKEYVACLAGSGQADRVAQVLEETSRSVPVMTDAWRACIAQGWAEIDRHTRALHHAEECGIIKPPTWQIAAMLVSAPKDKLPVLARKLTGQSAHQAPTMIGTLLAEALCPVADEPASYELTIHAIRHIAQYMEKPQPDPVAARDGRMSIPRTVLQYWSQGEPPAQIRPALRSWQSAPQFQHILLDRQSAQRFLHRELGQDWVRAFNRAGSPTAECDFLRLCHIGLHGGIYADCDDWLIGDIEDLLGDGQCLTLYREPTGALGNNIIIAPPRHPAILWAAFSARRALLEGHGDNVWNRSGPGLLTRAVVWHLETLRKDGHDPALRLLPRWMLGRTVQYHSPLGYKFGAGYWNRRNQAGSLSALAEHFK